MRLVARDEHDSCSRVEHLLGRREQVCLGVAVQLHRVVSRHAALHAAGRVEHEDVEAAVLPLDLREQRLDLVRDGQIRTDGDCRAALLLDCSNQFEGACLLVAEVDDDLRAGLGKVADGVRPDAARRTGDENALAGELARL